MEPHYKFNSLPPPFLRAHTLTNPVSLHLQSQVMFVVRRIKATNSHSNLDPIEAFFSRYPSFNYHPSDDWRQLGPFNALAAHCGWSRDYRKIQLKHFKQRWTQVVESEFSDSSLTHYQSVCSDLDISPIPETVEGCKDELREVFVNIVDLMQYRKDRQMGLPGKKPTKFRTLAKLKNYSASTEKYYPRMEAKAQMLRELLKELL